MTAPTPPFITLYASDDGGITFRAFPMRSIGLSGQYQNRVLWFNLGMSRERVYKFEISENVETWTTDLVLDADAARW